MYSQEDETRFGWMSQYTLVDEDGVESDIKSIEDHTQNGKYCKSGMAIMSGPNEAQCASTKSIMFKDEELDDPYECDPVDPFYKCQITFITGQDDTGNDIESYTETPC